jgi:hypothetical protein
MVPFRSAEHENEKYVPPRRGLVSASVLLRHAGMDCRHTDSQDASGDIHVNLDSTIPCWNDEMAQPANTATVRPITYFTRAAKDSRRLCSFKLSNFVPFATFVVKILSAFVAGVPALLPQLLLAQEPLRAGTIFSATQAPLWAAREGRYFEKYGIRNLEMIQFSGGQPVTRALIGGDIQISTTGGAQDLTKAKEEGRVVFYTSWGPSDADYVIKAFERKYPFLKVEPVRASTDGCEMQILRLSPQDDITTHSLESGSVWLYAFNHRLLGNESPVTRYGETLCP